MKKLLFLIMISFSASLLFSQMTDSISYKQDSGWNKSNEILSRIKAPVFPDRDFVITNFGAVEGGKQDCSKAIAKAVEKCSSEGGGRVVIPKGVFLTGAIHLKSNINLHIVKGATLLFQTDPKAYLPVVYTRWEGIECMNYSPFIYAFEQKNIAVTGEGTIDGSASEDIWWDWARRSPGKKALAAHDVKMLNQMSEQSVPVEKRIFGEGHFLRPNFIQTYKCENVLIEGITILRSPMWQVHPVLCKNVTIRNLIINSHGPNNDGCNPESSRDILIENCLFDTGDDCIAIKSGRNDDGRRIGVPSENIIIRKCTMKDGHAGVAIGSEIAGDCRNVFIEDCSMDSPNLDRALRIKSNARRGGTIENIYMRKINIGKVSEALLTIDFLYEEGPNGSFPPIVRNIDIENVVSNASPRLFFITGFKGATIENIRIANSKFSGVTDTEVIEYTGKVLLENVTIEPAKKAKSLSSRRSEE